MNKFIFIFSFCIAITSFSQNKLENNSFDKLKPQSAVFEENKGQMKDQFWKSRPDVLFYGASEGMNYYIKNSGMSYQLSRVESWKDEEELTHSLKEGNEECKQVPDQIGTYRVDAEWLNANPSFEVVKGKELDGYNNYYNVPEGVEPALYVKKYEAITLKNVWDGIDLHYYGTGGFLETDYLVAPGADYRKIQIQFKGAELSTDEKGNLIIKTPFGEIQEGALKVYQNNERIEAYWKISKDNVVSFEIPNYNADLALRIDPLTRVWGTYYGGGSSEYAGNHNLEIDGLNNAYMGGYTYSSLSGISSGGHQNTHGGGNMDCFLVKFNALGNRVWGTYYGGNGGESGGSVDVDPFGNVLFFGQTYSTMNISANGYQNNIGGDEDAFLVKFNSNGLRIWSTYVGGSGPEYARTVLSDLLGNIYITGSTGSSSGISLGGHQNTYIGATNAGGGIGGDAYLIKFNSQGIKLWGTYYGGSLQEFGEDIYSDINNDVYLTGTTQSNSNIGSGGHQNTFGGDNDAFLVKFNSQGIRLWATYYGGSGYDQGLSVIGDQNGNIYLSGLTRSWNSIAFNGFQMNYGGGTITGDAFLVKLNSSGVRQWATYFGGMGDDSGQALAINNIGEIYLGGSTSSNNAIAFNGLQNDFLGMNEGFFSKFSSNGNRIWSTYYGGSQNDGLKDLAFTSDMSLLTSGNTQSAENISLNGFQNSLFGTNDLFLVKFEESKINGKIWLDWNSNCGQESSETTLIDGINLTIQPGNIISQSIDGFWSLDSLSAGNYTITIDTTNLNWLPTCPITQSFTVTNTNGFTVGPNFGLISTNPCSDPDVSIYAPFLRRCFSNQKVYVNACNQSTATGILNASYVDVELDPLLTVNSATLPYTSQGNNVFRFQTGNLNPGQCVNFSISTTVSCNAMLGQTLCMDANLFPVQSCALDTIPSDPIVNNGTGGTLNGFPQPCTLPWDQSSLSVDGWCQGDSVYFSITNTGEPGGGDMECYSPMWVTVDGVVTYTDSIMIPGGQTVIFSYFGNGQTWILNAEQHPLHPGNSHPNAHVEACGDTSNWTPDIVDDFPQDDADPVVDIYCGVVTGSYDPNDKTGYPIGQTTQKYIQPNQQLQYVIRFQNTGTDTAFTVVIRDTLDIDLNIFTVTAGVSSHQYEFRMYGPRVLEWTFNNILLPDSTTNSDGSNGFVTFHVEQVPNLAQGTEITNDADIYFDFNAPITTNTTMHRIYEGFVSVLNVAELSQNGKSLLIYPNPISHSITIKGEKNMNQPFSIFDQMGREVFKGKLTGTETEVNLSALSKGMYTLKIEGNYQPAQIVKE